MDYEQLAKKYRKKAVLDTDSPSFTRVIYDRLSIEKIIPHRDPFLLLDRITGIDLDVGGITATRKIDPSNPLFKGHFPNYPIFPGVLQVEMIGQLSVCLYDFLKRQNVEITENSTELGVRALRIYHTLFQHEVLPGDEVTIMGKLLEKDEYTFKGIGQVLNGVKVCTIAIADFYIV